MKSVEDIKPRYDEMSDAARKRYNKLYWPEMDKLPEGATPDQTIEMLSNLRRRAQQEVGDIDSTSC